MYIRPTGPLYQGPRTIRLKCHSVSSEPANGLIIPPLPPLDSRSSPPASIRSEGFKNPRSKKRMFEHFTFGAQAQTRCSQQDEVSASPTDTSFVSTIQPPLPHSQYPFPEIPAISDIVNKFTNHTLRPEEHEEVARPSIWADTLSSPTFDDPFTVRGLSYVSTRRGMTTIRSTLTSAPNTSHLSSQGDLGCRRSQRQLNTQLHSCTNHMKGIHSLVEDMVSSNSQCILHTSTSRQTPSRSPPPSTRITGSRNEDLVVDDIMVDEGISSYQQSQVDPDEDEGFAEMEDYMVTDEEISLMRASTPSGIRKYAVGIKYRSSGDCVQNGDVPREKHKIRCMPRMRKRKVYKGVAVG